MKSTSVALRQKASDIWRSLVFGAATLISFLLYFRVFAPLSDVSGFLSIPMFIVGYVTLIFLIVLVHELGHAAAARMMNWDVREIVVGALIYRPPTNSWLWDIYRETTRENEDYGGWVVAFPPKRKNTFAGDFFFCLGGSLATFICGSGLLYLSDQPNISVTDWSDPLVGLGLLFYLDALVNLLPSHRRGVSRTDGMQLLDLVLANRGRIKASLRAEAIWRVWAGLSDGKALDHEDIALLSEIERSNNQIDELSLQVMLSAFYKTGRLGQARSVLEKLHKLNGTLTDIQKVELAFCVATLDQDVHRAELLLAELQPDADRNSVGYLRAKATIDYLAGRQKAAEDAIRKIQESKEPGLDADDEALFAAILTKSKLPWTVTDE